MTYLETMELVTFLNDRFQKAGMRPWYEWAVEIAWEKLQIWGVKLGMEEKP